MKHKKTKIFTFAIFLFIVICIQLLSSCFIDIGEGTWYKTLHLPTFIPRGSFISLIWLILYTLIALAGSILYLAAPTENRKMALMFFGVQLVLNLLWPYFFFYLNRPTLAAYDLVALWICVLLCITYSFRVSRLAAALLIPYILWLSYAITLNFTILYLNP